MIAPITANLDRAVSLLNSLSDHEYCDASVAPYHSSIGSHIRHILDFYDCIFAGVPAGHIDLTERRRDLETEQVCDKAIDRIDSIKLQLRSYEGQLGESVRVVDDLGNGPLVFQTSLGALFAQANSHTIHHYAIISYILSSLGIAVKDEKFGYNPTTPIISS